MIAKAMRAILLASATATSLKGLVCMSFFAKGRICKAAFSPPERVYGTAATTKPKGPRLVFWARIFRFAAPREAPILSKHPRRALGCQRVGKTLAFYGVKAGCRRKEIETVTLGVAG